MKTQFAQVATRKEATKEMPWAVKIVKVCGGHQGFESMDDYHTWKAQR